MAWIELHQSLPTHRKTLDLADALDVPVVQTVGHLTCLWLWALDNAPDGDLSSVKPRTLARAALWERDAQTFWDALHAAGFVDAGGAIHDWWEYAGRLIDQRRRNAAKQKAWRERQRTQDVAVTASPYIEARDGDVTVTSPGTKGLRTAATVPNPTVPNHSLLTERETPDADAPDANPEPEPVKVASEPLKTKAAPKPKGVSLTPLADAFIALDVPFPGSRTAKETQAAQALLGRGTPEEVAACWKSILDGEYGSDFDQRRLTFAHLNGDRFFDNWLLHQRGLMQAPKRRLSGNGTVPPPAPRQPTPREAPVLPEGEHLRPMTPEQRAEWQAIVQRGVATIGRGPTAPAQQTKG